MKLDEELHRQLQRVKTCTDLSKAREIHVQIEQSLHLSHDRLVLNSLIEMYGKCGDLISARNVFDGMRSRNVFSWNIMLTAYATNGHLHEAAELFDGMVLKDCVSWNSMITAYSQVGDLVRARFLFDQMPLRDVVSWNTMITAYAENGHSVQAILVFRLMLSEGCKPNEITFINVADACGNLKSLSEGSKLHELIKSNRLKCGVELGTSLVDMYHRCGSPENARRAFQDMPVKDSVAWTAMIQVHSQCGEVEEARTVFDSIHQPTTGSWNAMVLAYAQNGHINEAVSLFHRMPQPDVISWTTMVSALGEAKRVDEARRMFDEMPVRNLVSWNAMIVAYSQSSRSMDAFELFQAMDLEGLEPNEVTVISVLDACASAMDLRTGRKVDREITSEEFYNDVVVATSLINMYGKCGSLRHSRQVFDGMLCARNAITWTALVSAYAHNGFSKEAKVTFQTMSSEGFETNSVSFKSILNACSHAGLLEDGCSYFVAMVAEFGIAPKLDHFVCMIDLLGRLGKLDAAQELINTMPYWPDQVSWMTLLGACKTHKDLTRAERVAEESVKMNGEDSAAYVLLSSLQHP